MAKSLKDLTAEIAQKEGWAVEKKPDGYTFTVPQPKGRKQRVTLLEFEYEQETLVRIISTVGPSQALTVDRLKQALALNCRLPYGCLAVDGGELVMTETRPLKTTTAATTGDAIRYIARQADLYEQMIFGKDTN